MQISKSLALVCLSTLFASSAHALEANNAISNEERYAYLTFEGKRPANIPDTFKSYTSKLSVGGKVYFYANRREFAKALGLLKTIPDQNSGSALYVKAFCLDGLGQSAESVKIFALASAKIDSVFRPGPKFFLQYANAQLHSGDISGCFKNLKKAENSSVQNEMLQEKEDSLISWTIERRLACIKEKQKNFRGAFFDYLSFFKTRKSQFHLDEPLKTDAQISLRARKWLADHNSGPVTTSVSEQAKYLLTRGKAFIAISDFAKAKVELEKLVALDPGSDLDPDRIGARAPRGGDAELPHGGLVSTNPLTKAKDEARVLLIRIYYPEKNFERCCVLIRGTFFMEPMESFSHYSMGIAMADVPQLVTKQDVALHDKNNEGLFDRADLKRKVYRMDIAKVRNSIAQFTNDPLLANARKQAESGNFNKSYEIIEQYLSKYETADNITIEDAEGRLFFRMHQYYRYALIQKGLALAAHRRDFILSFKNDKRFNGPIWANIETHLLGDAAPLSADDKKITDKMTSFIYWSALADGINCMYRKDNRAALKHFKVSADVKSGDKDLIAYSKVLGNYCSVAK